ECQLFVKCIADALCYAAANLAGKDHRIDDRAAIMHHGVFENLELEGLSIDLDEHRVYAVGGGSARWSEILRRFQSRLGARLHRAAHRVGVLGQRAKREK